ncbi:MAG TPA: hypothetical protein VD862_04030 [Candidatus Paceibacterota bacterium]|nr:hypothetical protein [Candidatus Paceibacterota bacterium]
MSDYASLADFRERAGYDIDGVWYPRITSIVSIKAKPALYRYYARMPDWRTADEAKERSAQEGTLVHLTVEAILKGMPMEVEEGIRPAVDAFLEFRRHHDIRPLLIEERVLSREHGYAGTIDILAELDGVVGVLDIKTSKAVYRDYGLQTAAYMQALSERSDIPPPRTTWVLRLDQSQSCAICGASMRNKGGNTRVTGGRWRCQHSWEPMQGHFELKEVGDFEHNFKAFLGAKTLWDWEYRSYLDRLAGAAGSR